MIDDGDDEELPPIGFIFASDVKPKDLDAAEKAVSDICLIFTEPDNYTVVQYLQKKKAGLAALGEWTHINCLKPSRGDVIQDDILRRIVETAIDAAVTGISSPVRTSNEGEAEALTGTARSIRDIPGGTVSFVFEKTAKTVLAEVEDA